MDDEEVLDLEPGDFLYQTDQELFLVVMEENDDSYLFSVHGWRDIGKPRLSEYLEGKHGKLHDKSQFEQVINEHGDDKTIENYERLKELFQLYSREFDADGPEKKFSMEDQQ